MNDENWKEEYKKLKSLRPYQIKLLEEGATSLSQAWLLNSMWCEWKEIKGISETNLPTIEACKVEAPADPWED